MGNDIVERSVDDAVALHRGPSEYRGLVSNHRLQDLMIDLVTHLDDGLESSQEFLDDRHVEPGEISPRHVAICANGKFDEREIRHLAQGYAMFEQQWSQPRLRL